MYNVQRKVERKVGKYIENKLMARVQMIIVQPASAHSFEVCI